MVLMTEVASVKELGSCSAQAVAKALSALPHGPVDAWEQYVAHGSDALLQNAILSTKQHSALRMQLELELER